MFALYEEDGQFKSGRILSEADTSLQIELSSGKRNKLKSASVLTKYTQPEGEALITAAQELSLGIELDFLWECAPQDEFDFNALAEDYFGNSPSVVESTAILFKLHSAPAYFHRKGKGKYRAAPIEILQAALAAIEKKQRQAEQQASWVTELCQGSLPDSIANVAKSFVYKPDKNSLEWKAFDQACQELQLSQDAFLLQLGVYPDALNLHLQRFMLEHFPKGIQHTTTSLPELDTDNYPFNPIEIYSVDNLSTNEIDDALSIQPLTEHQYRLGIHIAAPSLMVARDSELDKVARQHMATLYIPGTKYTMQSPLISERFSLDENTVKPCVSLYVDIDTEAGCILETKSLIERVQVTANLRNEHLDALLTEEALTNAEENIPHGAFFKSLWKVFVVLHQLREQKRGKPERNNHVDFNFHIDGNPLNPNDAKVTIDMRTRQAPLDRMIGEFMILANSIWAEMQANADVPAIYRSQHLGRVKTSTYPGPHDSMGVNYYAWHTSPLRRYVDLVNQRQLLSTIEHGISARLVAPFKPKDADLFAIINQFESRYTVYQDFQQRIETFWCFRYLAQQHLLGRPMNAVVIKENLIRIENLPLFTRLNGLPELENGTRIAVEILNTDELTLSFETRYLEKLPDPNEQD